MTSTGSFQAAVVTLGARGPESAYLLRSLQVDQVRCGWGMPRPRQRTVCSPLAGWLSLSSSTRTGTAWRGQEARRWGGQEGQSVRKAQGRTWPRVSPGWGEGSLRLQVNIKYQESLCEN